MGKNKTRYNPRSLANLKQYGGTKAERIKECVERREALLAKILTQHDSPIDERIFERLIPTQQILKPDEFSVYNDLVAVFLRDFSSDELNASDVDDIVSIALNRVLELRLLQQAKDNPDMLIDAAATIEKLRKHTDKLRGNLASRRIDRVDVRSKGSVSILDLAERFDRQKREELDKKLKDYQKEEAELNLLDAAEEEGLVG